MNKIEFIKSLKNVKVVIGNGFDLHCGLHTTYSDYYCKNYKKYLYIQDLYKKYEETSKLSLDFNDKKIKLPNSWDVFFALNSSKNPKECKQRWCDIEKMILASLYRYDEGSDINIIANSLCSKINWPIINDCLVKDKLATNHIDRFVVSFCKGKMESCKYRVSNFYQFLVDELKDFEKNFGNFIYYQLHNSWYERCNPGQVFLNTAYIEMAIDTLNELCDEKNLVGIDSFNYSYIHTEKMMKLIQHINGSWDNPIFGIDTKFEPNDNSFLFTKTSRRIDSDMFDDSFDAKPSFDNLVIFGHSLNEADYSYFFPMFDKLHLIDSTASNVIVFAYSVYDEENELDIKSELRQSISNILYSYAKSKNLIDPERFLDSLSIQKRIITYEIPKLNRKLYGYSLIDQDWEKIYKEIDSLNIVS